MRVIHGKALGCAGLQALAFGAPPSIPDVARRRHPFVALRTLPLELRSVVAIFRGQAAATTLCRCRMHVLDGQPLAIATMKVLAFPTPRPGNDATRLCPPCMAALALPLQLRSRISIRPREAFSTAFSGDATHIA